MKQIYSIKGCPFCGRKPLLIQQEGRFILDCTSHPNFKVHSFGDLETPEVMDLMSEDPCPRMPLSDEQVLKELIEDWNDDECYLRLGADHRTLASRGCFDVTIIER